MMRWAAIAMVCSVFIAGGAHAEEFSYENYDSVLATHVDERGFVDYAALKANREPLDEFVALLVTLSPRARDSWSEADQIAFWVNAYNALTLKLIVDHYPIDASAAKALEWPRNSVRQIPGAWTDVTFDVMGDDLTLDHIEHKILRAHFDEPRIHMALVCAAVSCPALHGEPYRGDALDTQLDDQARRFLADPGKFQIDREGGVVRVSAIFSWFAGDFVPRYGGNGPLDPKSQAVMNFIVRYVSAADRTFLESGAFELKHFDYDWTLNDASR